jgi:hypothetical protein
MEKKMNLKKWQELKDKLANLERQASEAQGAIKQLQGHLQEEFACGSIEQADKLLTKLKKEQDQLTIQFDQSLEEFNQKWKEKL